MSRVKFARDFILGEKSCATDVLRWGRDRRAVPLLGKGEDFEIALAGENDGQEAAVGRDIEFTNRDAAEDWLRRRCEDGNVFEVFFCSENGNIDPDEIAGFSFDGALEHDAVFVGRPVENAEAYAQSDEIIGDGEIPHFKNFAVDEVSDFFAAW